MYDNNASKQLSKYHEQVATSSWTEESVNHTMAFISLLHESVYLRIIVRLRCNLGISQVFSATLRSVIGRRMSYRAEIKQIMNGQKIVTIDPFPFWGLIGVNTISSSHHDK